MGTLVGHVLPGLVFLIIGLWHLYNHIKNHFQRPKSSPPPTWFPAPRVRHLELYFIMLCSGTYIITELFVGPSGHQPLDPADWSIPASHLHNFEHATITVALLVYAAFALHLDRVRPRAGGTLALLLGAATFAVELLIFYLHSTDHVGVEWQYHWLLQTTIVASLATTVLGIGYPRSFAVGFTRSVSVLFQGVWSIVLGFMLYTPRFIPKGCSLQNHDGMLVIPCDGPASLHRAKALVNLEFAWSLVAVAAFSVWFYLHMAKKYPKAAEYECLEENGQAEDESLESPKKNPQEKEAKSGSLLQMGTWLGPMDLES